MVIHIKKVRNMKVFKNSLLAVASLMIWLSVSCSKEETSDIVIDDKSVIMADTLICNKLKDTIPSGMICDIRYIPLKETNQGVFSDVYKLFVVDSSYIVVDKSKHRIATFSETGDLLYKIDNMGHGPTEYLEIAAAAATDSVIYVVDNFSNRLQQYSISDGQYIKSTTLPFIAWDIEALSDDDFLFTCLNLNPDAKILPKPINYAVWRTNGEMEITDKYLPVSDEYTEMIGKSRYFSKDKDGNVAFHMYKYPGYFTFTKEDRPEYHHVVLKRPIPSDKQLSYSDVLDKGYEYIDETPFVYDDCWVAAIAKDEAAEQMLGSYRENKILKNSHSWASNLLVNIIGVNKDGFVGILNDDADQYQSLIEHGFPRADAQTENYLKQGCSVLIQYTICK